MGSGPIPSQPRSCPMFKISGQQIHAPGFTAEQFDRAVHRAHLEDLRIYPTPTKGTVVVSNMTSRRVYRTTRTSCTCLAGERGIGCKHRALCIFLADVVGLDLSTPGLPKRAAA